MQKQLRQNTGRLPISLPHPHANAQNKPNPPYRWRLAGFSSPKYAKRTQSPYGHGMPCPKYAKRTQIPQANSQSPKPNSQNMRNERNSTKPTANRQSPTPKNTKRTQSPPPIYNIQYTIPLPNSTRPTAKSQQQTANICETNPIPTRFGFPPTHPGMQLRETNPIPVRTRHAVPLPRETNPILTIQVHPNSLPLKHLYQFKPD